MRRASYRTVIKICCFGRFEKQNSMTYFDGHTQRQLKCKNMSQGFPGAPVIKNLPCNARDLSSIPVWADPTCLGAAKHVHHN